VNGSIQFEMRPDERDLVLRHSRPSKDVQRRLTFGIHAPSGLVYTFPPDTFLELMACVATGVEGAPTPQVRRKLVDLYERLAVVEEAHEDVLPAEDTERDEFLRGMPPHLRDAVAGVLDDPRFETLDQVNAALQAVMQVHNQMPIAQFAGLSPEQMLRLFHDDWLNPGGGFVVRRDLALSDVGHAQTFRNARTMLAALGRDGTRATKTGNLNIAFVGRMAHDLEYPNKEILLEMNKRTNERSFRAVEDLRHLLIWAGLIRKHKGVFKATRKAHTLLSDEKAGELYVLLFLTMFQTYDLGYPMFGDEFAPLQAALPFAAYALGKYAATWCEIEALAPAIILPTLLPDVDFSHYIYQPAYLARTFVLRPLEALGVIECRGEDLSEGAAGEAQITPLYHRLFEFRL
jgi:hypothetical protein